MCSVYIFSARLHDFLFYQAHPLKIFPMSGLVNDEIKSVLTKGLIDIENHNLNIVHNAFHKGLKVLGMDVHQLVINVFYFFRSWPLRFEEV